jgi:predicted MPP superfamily phosphohydrolase
MSEYYAIAAMLLTVVTLLSGLLNAFMLFRQQAILATMKKEMAELELRILFRLNDTHIRADLCNERHQNTLDSIEVLDKAFTRLSNPNPAL